jgi:hypothetical protein
MVCTIKFSFKFEFEVGFFSAVTEVMTTAVE